MMVDRPQQHVVLTPYQAVKHVNRALARAGVRDPRTGEPKKIGSPMLYTYAAKGKIKRRRAPHDGRWDLDAESFHEWLDKYIARALERQQLREELDEDGS